MIRASELRDENDVLTHKMCSCCMEFIPVDDLYVCEHGSKWDSCKPCEAENPISCHCDTEETYTSATEEM